MYHLLVFCKHLPPTLPPHTHHTDTLETSFGHAENADLCVVMGSSLTVTPAANIPEVYHQLVVVHVVLQIIGITPTPSPLLLC